MSTKQNDTFLEAYREELVALKRREEEIREILKEAGYINLPEE